MRWESACDVNAACFPSRESATPVSLPLPVVNRSSDPASRLWGSTVIRHRFET